MVPGRARPTRSGPPVGRVLGTEDATPLEFWVAVAEGRYLQLDDVVALERALPDGRAGAHLRRRHPGAGPPRGRPLRQRRLPHRGRRAAGRGQRGGAGPRHPLRARGVRAAAPGHAGAPGRGRRARPRRCSSTGWSAGSRRACRRDDEPIYLNLDFLDGTRGAHVNISGISGVATKTSYATFLLYCAVPRRACSAPRRVNTKALIFNVKGEDLLFLDHPNIDARRRAGATATRRSGLPAGAFPSVGVLRAAPPGRRRRRARRRQPRRSASRSFFWTLDEFCRRRAAAVPVRRRRGRPPAVHDGRPQRHRPAAAMPRRRATARCQHRRARSCGTFRDLVDLIAEPARSTTTAGDRTGPDRAIGAGTVNAFVRRLLRRRAPRRSTSIRGRRARPRARTASQLERAGDGRRPPQPERPRQALRRRRRRCARRSRTRSAPGQARPLQFVVLDELNKYAPRDGSSPIKEILLDVAERGRSLGIVLIGAQQTASEVERRIVANSAIRVVGRLDAAEAGARRVRLPARRCSAQRATILKPGTMIVAQPELPVPLVVEFPFPAWATRASEAGVGPPAARTRDGERRARRSRSTACHEVPAHLRLARRQDDPRAQPRRRAPRRAGRDRGDRRGRAGRRSCSSPATCSTPPRPTPEAEQIVYDALLALRRDRRPRRGHRRQPRQRAPARRPSRRCSSSGTGHRRRVVPAARRRRRGRGRVPGRRRAGQGRRCCRSCRSADVVRADDLMAGPPPTSRPRRTPSACAGSSAALTAGFAADAVNLVVAHLIVDRRAARRRRARRPHGLRLRGAGHRLPGQRALRRPRPPAPRAGDRRRRAPSGTAARRCSSTSARPRTRRRCCVVEAAPRAGRVDAAAVPLAAGRRLRTLRGTLRARCWPRPGRPATTTCASRAARRRGSAWPTRCGELFPTASTSRWCGPAPRAPRPAVSDAATGGSRGTLRPTALFRRTWPTAGRGRTRRSLGALRRAARGAARRCGRSGSSSRASPPFRERTVVDFDGADLFALTGPTGRRQVEPHRRHDLRAVRHRAALRRRPAGAPVVSQGRDRGRVRLDFDVGGERYTAVRVVRRATAGRRRREARLERAGEVLAGTPRSSTREVAALLGLTSSSSRPASSCPRASSPASCTPSRPSARTCSSGCWSSACSTRSARRPGRWPGAWRGSGRSSPPTSPRLSVATPEAVAEEQARCGRLEALVRRGGPPARAGPRPSAGATSCRARCGGRGGPGS